MLYASYVYESGRYLQRVFSGKKSVCSGCLYTTRGEEKALDIIAS
jgi:hypothetical protein